MKKIFIYSLIILAFSAQVVNAQAKNEYTLLEPLPAVDGSGTFMKTINLNTYIEYVFKFSIALAVFLAVIMIIWGGFEYMLSEIPFIKTNAKSRITNAIMGLLGALVSYLILVTIDPRLVQINTTIDPIKINTSEAINFRNALAQDLAKLTDESRQSVLASQTKIESLTAQRVELARKCEEGIIDDEDACMRDIAKIDSDIRKEKTSLYRNVTEQIGLGHFNNTINLLNDPKNWTETATYKEANSRRIFDIKNSALSEESEKSLVESKETIKGKYDEYIAKIKISDPQTSQLLEKQRDFYISEIDSERVVNGYILSYKNSDLFLDGNASAYHELAGISIENEIKKYEAAYENPQKGRDAGLEEEYKKMVMKRVEVLKSALYDQAETGQ